MVGRIFGGAGWVPVCLAIVFGVAVGASGTAPHEPGNAVAVFLRQVGIDHRVLQDDARPVHLVRDRQDWKQLTPDLACHTLTPLCIGSRTYRKGLGAHANGLAVFALNGRFTRFLADVGVDNNADTAGRRGSVRFVVRVDGREVAHTPVCRGGDECRHLSVQVAGARTLELEVNDAGDGYSYDQADWADARLVAGTGDSVYLSDVVRWARTSPFLTQKTLPATFVYGGEPSAKLLATWPRDDRVTTDANGREVHIVTWREPGHGLVAELRAMQFPGADAVELRWSFRNEGTASARLLSNAMALDLVADVPDGQAQLVHSSGGLTGGMRDSDLGFAVSETTLGSSTLCGAGGRSSNRDLPFFLLHDSSAGAGIYVGVGWSGQWQADIVPVSGGKQLRVAVCMPGMNLALAPGEAIIAPSVLLGAYTGEPADGSNKLRRLLYDRYVPRLAGRKPLAPISWNHWFTFENRVNAQMLRRQAELAASVGVEYFCIDSGWFDGDFPSGVGNWTLSTAKFPGGLGPVGEHVRSLGMKLGLWFEPERVAAGTRLQREHPDWVHGDLLDLGNPDAREWVFRMMSHYIDEGGVRWIRFDFNTEPLPTWDSLDTADTRGRAQIRHIMGLYELLDRLMAAYPDLLIEGCASGGRRIDLETVRRSHTFWKSDDTARLPVMRFHETGGNVFLPSCLLNANLLTPTSDIEVRGMFGGPLGFGCDWTSVSAPLLDRIRGWVREYRELRPLLNEDYYPLFAQVRDETSWIGWQLHDPSAQRGFCVVLHPKGSPYTGAKVRFRGLEEGSRYEVEVAGKKQMARGSDLAAGLECRPPENGSVLIRYARVR